MYTYVRAYVPTLTQFGRATRQYRKDEARGLAQSWCFRSKKKKKITEAEVVSFIVSLVLLRAGPRLDSTECDSLKNSVLPHG